MYGKNSMTIAELVTALGQFPVDAQVSTAGTTDETTRGVGGVSSYRGYYECLALEPGPLSQSLNTVGEVIHMLVSAVGKTFEGYKGGSYQMGLHTEVFLAPYGECGPLITDVALSGRTGYVYFVTEDQEFS